MIIFYQSIEQCYIKLPINITVKKKPKLLDNDIR